MRRRTTISNPFSPTPEQRAIVGCDDAKISVAAAAGSGKTTILVERYLRHVVTEGLRPDQILTITFTRKAAAEMKRRIVEGLRERRLLNEAQIAETGPIQTIHSFCERLLRENAIEAGVDAQFEILAESASLRMQNYAVRAALSADLEDSPEAERLIASLAGKRKFGSISSPYGTLEKSVRDLLTSLRGGGVPPESLSEMSRSVHSLDRARATAFRSIFSSDVPGLEFCSSLQECQAVLRGHLQTSGQKMPTWLRPVWDDDGEAKALQTSCGLLQLTRLAWDKLSELMQERQQFDFTELEARGVRVLENSSVVCRRMRSQFRVAMVDEAQDVNPLQYQLLDKLCCDREFMVGDAQQSIYGFRHADLTLFSQRAGENPKRLTKNHRSAVGILNFVDTIFGDLWTGSYRPMAPRPVVLDLFDPANQQLDDENYEGVEMWEYLVPSPSATARFVGELHADGSAYKDIAVLTRNGRDAVQILEALQQADIPARIFGGSERYYTRMEVRDVANCLRALADPDDDFALLATLRSPLCGLSLDSIVALGDSKPVYEALVEYVPLSDRDRDALDKFRGWFVPLSRYADRLSAWEVVGKLFSDTDYLAKLARRKNGRQLLANVRKLLSLAIEEPNLGPLEFADQIREIQELQHREGDAPIEGEQENLVTISTVHKSKGLEFPVVVLPQTHQKILHPGADVLSDPRRGLVATKLSGDNLLYRYLLEEKNQKEKEEEMRVLYVAMTRAKCKLCVALYPNKNHDTVSKRLRKILGSDFHPSIRVRRVGM